MTEGVRPDLAAVQAAKRATLDTARATDVARQHARGRRTARENVADLLDPGSFTEYGQLARPLTEGMTGAADGVVMGTGAVAGQPVAVVAYDYMVYAGTQSANNHAKLTRMFELAELHRWPVVTWLDGGGARPHDMKVSGRKASETFVIFARLSGLAPTIGIVSGRAFAGQANLAGLCDLLIMTPGASMGMAGPPLVEAALGVKLTPEEIGPTDVHVASGVLDVSAADDAEATSLAKRYLAYFRGRQPAGAAPDVAKLRTLVPENPRRAYNVKRAIDGIADVATVFELKTNFGKAVVTSLIRIEGHPIGVIANQPMVLAGAIDSPASDKTARFIQLCDAYDIPLLFLADTPGLMVGPEVEKTALVRHSARVLTALANATVPYMTVVLRKAYGLGYYIMGSDALTPSILLAWPTAEFGGMGLEGATNIIYKRELDAAPDGETRARLHAEFTAELKRYNTALEVAGRFRYDDVIDPADTRAILARTLAALPPPPPRTGRKRIIDPW
jgi:acetyl-CoA carboxylase carboxyltransferase component